MPRGTPNDASSCALRAGCELIERRPALPGNRRRYYRGICASASGRIFAGRFDAGLHRMRKRCRTRRSSVLSGQLAARGHAIGWLEKDLAADGVTVRWLFSAGSNKANELISSDSADFASTAGSAALLARTNGVPQRTVYVYSRPEWAQLLVSEKSGIKTVADLRGKKLAATRGTDLFTLALRALRRKRPSRPGRRRGRNGTSQRLRRLLWPGNAATSTPGRRSIPSWPARSSRTTGASCSAR